MEDSILTSVKKKIGMTETYTVFDDDIIDHINTVFMILYQMGVGPSTPYAIEDASSTWDEFIPADNNNFNAVRTYVYLKAQMVFDPPTSSSVMQAKKDAITELEWRLHLEAEINK